ncbi:hypothetical protein [Megalodesulfovibrio gigas]|uniref:Uncharacterized protein n=1 Tax=Megalodesulfovibrio gigas (strain ATCC 19364 / DSM 1382 / NCIMB 9332 / VKM B-1759) TaxID=1121448 RepID=T2GC59_MEGG1|nr:hypothetical protein [Megalodesulfovibrio gigas]AGW13497.1 hypothetical protein DGI_1675 [Megalodesulfovibrio gigas DSM 1382 = ATCC 19364]
MSINSIDGFGSSGVWDQQTFGAAVVSKTLDYMNNQGSASAVAAPFDKQTFGASVVNKTLDYMNSPSFASGGASGGADAMSQSYAFNKDVLGSYAAGIGALANTWA